ncbi:MAG: GNAT family N-acetyltransferase, partial [Thermoleophilia bacterium]|nr:GNAT family N-acetyltransferase [Thermoleophilia bacterium]
PADADAVVALLEAAVGAGFAGSAAADPRLSWVALDDGLCGAALAVVDDAPHLRRTYAEGPAFAALERLPVRGRIVRIRELAVRADRRGRGVASDLVARVEAAAAGLAFLRGLETIHVLANAWLPTDPALPTSAGLFRRAGYEDLGEIAGFFREFSLNAGATCPACGPPPCRCGVRVMLKRLPPD